MIHASVSPLRQRLIDDMTIRHFAPRTQQAYIRAIRRFSAFLGASPDQAGFEDVRRYQLFLSETGASPPTINHAVTALRFLFQVTLLRPEVMQQIPFVPEPRKLPVVLSPDEVARLLEAAPNLKSKAALSVAYGAGLRASEVVTLKVSDIDSTRMVIRVEQGKGRSLCHALAAASRAPARLVEGGPAAGLALSRPEPGQPAHPSSTASVMPLPVWPRSTSP